MKVVLDTNAYSLCDAANDDALDVVQDARSLFLPVIAYGELYCGFRHGAHFEENLKRLDRFIDDFGVEVIEVTRDVARNFGDIYASLRKKGRPIPINDIWISACCMSAGGTLLTADSHFKEVDQIQSRIIIG